MPTITVSVDLGAEDPAFKQYEVNLDQTVGSIKDLVQKDFGLPTAYQHVYRNEEKLDNASQNLADAGVGDQDLLLITQVSGNQQAQSSNQDAAGFNEQVEGIRRDLIERTRDPAQRRAFAQQAPDLEAALNDPERFRTAFEEQRRRGGQQGNQQEDMDIMNNEMSEDSQAKIMERIRQEQVEQEATRALDEHPELFGRVTMLYIQLEVNGHPVKAFVDSGAQATIMSPSCAETCGVTKSIDTRFAGIAKGVGTAKILGRVHMAPVKIGNYELPCGFTVMEGKDVDLLLGLDMLKRYQCCIDLQKNVLILGGGSTSVPFLGESEIPKYFEGPDEEEGSVKQESVIKPDPTSPQASKGSAASKFGGQGRTLGPAGSSSTQPSTAPLPTQPDTPRSTVSHRPAAPTPGQAQYPQKDIDMLVGLGASRDQAIQLLRACQGNAEYAAGMLFDQ